MLQAFCSETVRTVNDAYTPLQKEFNAISMSYCFFQGTKGEALPEKLYSVEKNHANVQRIKDEIMKTQKLCSYTLLKKERPPH